MLIISKILQYSKNAANIQTHKQNEVFHDSSRPLDFILVHDIHISRNFHNLKNKTKRGIKIGLRFFSEAN